MRRRQLPGEPEPPSKGELKRQAHAVQELADRLVEAPEATIAGLDLPERLHDAVMLARRIRGGGALVRQKQFVAKLMRGTDVESIRAALLEQDAERLLDARLFRQVEGWRDRILEEGLPAVEALAAECPSLDTAEFRTLAENARQELRAGRSRGSARELFRAVDRALRQA
jgi:ribosome-associated protein